MSDDLTDRMSRLPSALPPVYWAPAAELRRIGRHRRRRRTAVVALGVALAIIAGTGVGYRLVATTAAPIQPSTSDSPITTPTPTPSPTPSPIPNVEAAGPVPASVMLTDADLPGYTLVDQVATRGVGPPNGPEYVTFVPACGVYAQLTIESVVGTNDFRYHAYFVGGDISQQHLDETVIRFGSADEVLTSRTRILQLVQSCRDPSAETGAVFSFVMDGTDPTGQPYPQRWTVVLAPHARLMAIIRTPKVFDEIGFLALDHLLS
jgi:hypothetical protein